MLLLSDNHHLKLGNGGQKIVGVGAVKGEERSLDPSARGIILAVVFARYVCPSGDLVTKIRSSTHCPLSVNAVFFLLENQDCDLFRMRGGGHCSGKAI